MVSLYPWVKGKPSTSRVYLEDSYVEELDVRVLDYVLEKGSKYYVVFDKTIFHPKSGG
jgi:alanyl-tRNA synthetase